MENISRLYYFYYGLQIKQNLMGVWKQGRVRRGRVSLPPFLPL